MAVDILINNPPIFKKGKGDHRFGIDRAPRNGGRPKGSRNKITVALEMIGEENAAAVYAKVIELALAGDMNACKLIIDRVYPVRKGSRVTIESEDNLDSVEGINGLSSHILSMTVAGELSAEEAYEYGKLLEQRVKNITDADVMKKIEQTYERVDMIREGEK